GASTPQVRAISAVVRRLHASRSTRHEPPHRDRLDPRPGDPPPGCKAAEPPRPPSVVSGPVEERIATAPPSAESEIGGLSDADVTDACAALQPGVIACAERGNERVGPLGGHVGLRLRITKQGAVRWAYLTESTLGDRETEKCVLDLARAKTWPR